MTITGHGIALNARHDTKRGVYPGHLDPLIQAAQTPGCQLVVVKQLWSEVETGPESYDTGFLRSCLDSVAAANSQCKLVAQVMHKAFYEDDQAAPEWIETAPTKVTHMPGGSTSATAVVWRPDVAARLHEVYVGIDESCRDHPAYGGVATEESAISVSEEVLQQTGYGPEAYAMSLLGLGGAQQAMKGTLFAYLNYLAENQPYLYTVAQALSSQGVAIGGPNLMPPGGEGLAEQEQKMSAAIQRLVEPIYDTLPDTAYTFGCAQAVDLRSYSPRVLLEHARARQRCLLIWTLRMVDKDKPALDLIAQPHGLRTPRVEYRTHPHAISEVESCLEAAHRAHSSAVAVASEAQTMVQAAESRVVAAEREIERLEGVLRVARGESIG